MDRLASNPIEQAESEIRRDREDLKRLKKRYPGFDFLPAKNGTALPTQTSLVQQESPARAINALEQAVLDEMASNPIEEWISRSVVARLRAGSAYRLAENDEAAMNSVALALVSLKELGKIERVHEGRGRDPHRYRVLPSREEEVPSEEKTP
jgi:hypothetical protein